MTSTGRTTIDAQDVAAAYDDILETAEMQITTAAAAATNYAVAPGGSNVLATAVPSGLASAKPLIIPIIGADISVGSMPAKLRLDAHVATINTAPAVDYTVSLNAYTIVAGAGVMGTAVAGSTFTITAPAANGVKNGSSGDFQIPADGPFVVIVTISGTPSANSSIRFRLLTRNT